MAQSSWRRWMRRALVVFVWLFVIFHVVAGWYFATLIRSDALAVRDFDDPEFTIVAVDDDTITLDGSDADTKDLLRDDLLGIDFGTGYGRVGQVIDVGGDIVTRTYTHITGEEPSEGLVATLHGVAYPRIPGVDDLPVWTEVTYSAEFGEFPAWLVERESARWAIVLHGRGAHREDGLRILPTLTDAGLTTLMISYRNDDDAPKTDDRLARFGATEWEDLEGAVRFAIDHGAEDVVLVGLSMGGAISLAFLERSELAGRVTGLILEAPAADLAWMVSNRAADTDLIPGLPLKVPPTLTVIARAWAEALYDVNWWILDYEDRADVIVDVPTLVIHGEVDDTVPVGIGVSIAEQLGDLATLEVFADADHVRSWNVDRARYERVVAEFLDRLRP